MNLWAWCSLHVILFEVNSTVVEDEAHFFLLLFTSSRFFDLCCRSVRNWMIPSHSLISACLHSLTRLRVCIFMLPDVQNLCLDQFLYCLWQEFLFCPLCCLYFYTINRPGAGLYLVGSCICCLFVSRPTCVRVFGEGYLSLAYHNNVISENWFVIGLWNIVNEFLDLLLLFHCTHPTFYLSFIPHLIVCSRAGTPSYNLWIDQSHWLLTQTVNCWGWKHSNFVWVCTQINVYNL